MDTVGPDGGAEDQAEEQRARSAAEVREYMQRLRSLPAEQLIADVLFSLLNAAQVKLGRRDARLLIDLSAVAHEHARPYLSGGLSEQVDQVLGQLRLSQVSAEGPASAPREPEENDLDRVPAPPSAGAPQSPAPQSPPPPPAPPPSRLWVPGR